MPLAKEMRATSIAFVKELPKLAGLRHILPENVCSSIYDPNRVSSVRCQLIAEKYFKFAAH
jgi:hypothetical protein